MNGLQLTQKQAAFYKDIDVHKVTGDKLRPQFDHNGHTMQVYPYETWDADVVLIEDGHVVAFHDLAVHNIPETQGLNAAAALAKVVDAAKAQYKSYEDSKHFILRWASGVTVWAVDTASDAYVNLEACSPDGKMHMVLDAAGDSTKVRIYLPKGRAGVQLIVDAPLRRDPMGLSGIVRMALNCLGNRDFTHI